MKSLHINPIRLLSFLLIASIYFVDISSVLPNSFLHQSNLYAQNTGPIVKLYLQPDSLYVSPDQTFSVNLKFDSTEKINAIQADLSYPSNLLQLTSIDPQNSAFPLEVLNNGSNGKISIVRGSFTPISGNDLTIAVLNFKALSYGMAFLDFDPTSAAVNSPKNSLTESPSGAITIGLKIPSPSPSLSPSPSPSPSKAPSPSPLASATPSASPTPFPSTTPTPEPLKSSILRIYAAGTQGLNAFPNLRVDIKDPKTKKFKSAKTFKDIQGNPAIRYFQQLTYTSSVKLTPSDIRLVFINDWYMPYVGDRNLIIDRINIDGTDYETEQNTTYSTGTWSSDNGCKAGYKKSEWLHCNGYFEYK